MDPQPTVPGADDPAIGTFGRLVEAVRRLDQIFAATLERELDLAMSHFEVLLRLGRSPGGQLRMSTLARQLGVTSGGATRLVDRVSADGLVERQACTSDRRVQHVRLTGSGRQLLADALRLHRADLARELTGRLDDDQRTTLDAILDELRSCTQVTAGAIDDEVDDGCGAQQAG